MIQPFYNVDPVAEANPLSRAVVRLFMEYEAPGAGEANATDLASGSGIIYHHREGKFAPTGRHFLVTAWHNLSGKDPATLKPKQGACSCGGSFARPGELERAASCPQVTLPTSWLF